MKKNLFLIIMMFFLTNSYGQEQKEFIEVMVEDSLEVEPEEIFYMVFISSSITTSDTAYLENTPAVKIPSPINDSELDKLYTLIKRMQIDTLPVTELNISNYDYDASAKTILLHFKSKTKLKEFVKEAKKIEGLTGSISILKNSRIEMYEQQLTKKLLTKAKNNATFIAEQSGKKLGKLLQVIEQQDESQGGWTVYPPLSALSQANFPNVSGKIILNKKLVVRYAW